MTNFLRRLSEEEHWTGPAAGVLGFLEGSFILFPMEPLFIPMMTAHISRAWWIALCLLVGNVAGGLLMYALGAWFLEPVIEPMIGFFSIEQEFERISDDLHDNAFITLFTIGVTPVPFQAGTAAAGALGIPLLIFTSAITLSRGIRYMAFAILVIAIGARARDVIKKYEKHIMIGGAVLFVIIAIWMLAS